MKRVDFTVTPSAGIVGYWIAVGREDVNLTANGKGSISLREGRKYVLSWHMEGISGSSIAIVGKDTGGISTVEIKQSSIPDGEESGAGFRRFAL